MTPPRFTQSARNGSTLLLVMWALILLASAVLVWARWIQQDIALSGDANRQLEARAMAGSGVAMALHPLVTQQTPWLTEELADTMGYKVQIQSEGGRLHLNWLIANEEPRKITMLKQWLEWKGVEFKDREVFVDSLLDYVDGDDLKRLNGNENEGDYVPANRALQTIEELEEVANAEALTSIPGWKDELTLYSAGTIDLSSASVNILRLLPGMSEARIQRFVTFRDGKDALNGTLDDNVFKTLGDVQKFLGFTEAQFQELGGLVNVKDPTVRIISAGHSGKIVRQIEVVATKGGGTPAIRHWKE
ncbi:MAG TPA: hypothetical protein VF614_03720 [Chthoniobacteraceae bacterium]|jgi:type II secretory pathway component PulK